MKLATLALLGIPFLAPFASMQADDKATTDPAGAGEVVLAFTGGSAYTATGGICVWYPVLLGDLKPDSLFDPMPGAKNDKEHAYLIWVSDFTAGPGLETFQTPDSPGKAFFLQLIPTGTATIYFRPDPENRKWNDLTKRSTWGDPVATFVRKAGMFLSADGGWSGTMTSTSELVSSKPFKLNGKTFNFKDLMPNGMTCYESGSGSDIGEDEAGTCVAIGGRK
jgi:hypothetical protein